MRSYASIGEIGRKFVTCEVELIPVEASRPEDFNLKPTEVFEVAIDMLKSVIAEFEEGDIIVVEHDKREVVYVCGKDKEEKERRIEVIQKLVKF